MKFIIDRISPLFLVFVLALAAAAQSSEYDPGHKEFAEVANFKISVPRGFDLERTPDANLSVMRNKKDAVAVFVAVADGKPDDKYLIDLSVKLAQLLYPKEKPFKWKTFGPEEGRKPVSKFETTEGGSKGLNKDKTLIQTLYTALKVNGRDILVGYVMEVSDKKDRSIKVNYLYDVDMMAAMSTEGRYAQSHLIASITGEKFQDLEPGMVIHTIPGANK